MSAPRLLGALLKPTLPYVLQRFGREVRFMARVSMLELYKEVRPCSVSATYWQYHHITSTLMGLAEQS